MIWVGELVPNKTNLCKSLVLSLIFQLEVFEITLMDLRDEYLKKQI
jgi:hypothetical protein